MKASNPLFDHIFDFCSQQKLLAEGSTLVIGLSGGPDSVFLLHYLAGLRQDLKLTLIAAHLDHGWRAESAQDSLFCQQMADRYQIPLIIKNLKDMPISFKSNGSKEELGRKVRRAFFEQIAKEHNAQAIALAHHADDQMETFIMRLIRGASLTGLAGMKPKDGIYIRPLLTISKKEILEYLHEHKIPYVIDASNQSDEYLRNRIRNHVIPAFKACDARFEKNFAATHAKLVETEDFLQKLSQDAYSSIIEPARADPSARSGVNARPVRRSLGEGRVEAFEPEKNSHPSINSGRAEILDIQKLLTFHPVIRNRVLINWLIQHKVPFTPSEGLLNEIVRFLENSKSKTHMLHQNWQIIKKDHKVSITTN